jgi:hypothetical protein
MHADKVENRKGILLTKYKPLSFSQKKNKRLIDNGSGFNYNANKNDPVDFRLNTLIYTISLLFLIYGIMGFTFFRFIDFKEKYHQALINIDENLET